MRKDLPPIEPYERTAHYYETDRMGIIHHSNYIRWFEETRIHYLDKAGYPYSEMEKDGVMIPGFLPNVLIKMPCVLTKRCL